jgi:thymidylate kinase
MKGRILTLVGADGAGKSTHARRLIGDFVGPAAYIYMGSNPSAVTHSLPTTRMWTWAKRVLGGKVYHSGPPNPGPVDRPSSAPRRLLQNVKSLGVVLLRATEELYRLTVAETLARRGYLVVLDRHPFLDYYQRRLRGNGGWLRWGDRLHAMLLRHVYPMPTEVVLLDGPPELLHERKREGTLDAVRARREEYLQLVGSLPREISMSVVDVRTSEDEVASTLLAMAHRDD